MSRRKQRYGNPGGAIADPVGAGRRHHPGERLHVAGICIMLAVLSLLVFRQTGTFAFVNYDDDTNVYRNSTVTQGLTASGIHYAFSTPQVGHWIPLTTISHMLGCEIFGMNAGGHHLINVLLHTVSAILLFGVLRRITATFWPGAFVAAVFLIHPLRVESVAWVTERKDVLSGVFFFLTIAAYARYARGPASSGRYLVVMAMFALGLMSKSMLVTLPFVLLLLDYWPLGRFGNPRGSNPDPGAGNPDFRRSSCLRLICEKLPLLAMSVVASVVTFHTASEGIHSLEKLSLALRIGNALTSCVTYVWQVFWPVNLAVFYPHPGDRLPLWEAVVAGGILAAISVAAIAMRRSKPWLLTGWLWYLGMVVPVIGIVQSGDLARADRYTYLPHIGLYLAITWTAVDLTRRLPNARKFLAAVGITVIPVMAVCSWLQTRHWKDGETLWKKALSCTQGNAIAHHNLGAIDAAEGRFDEALDHYQTSLELRPSELVFINLGNLLARNGRATEAIDHFQAALRRLPDNPRLHSNLGNAFLLDNRVEEAIAAFKKALARDPRSAETHANLALALEQAGSPGAAVPHYQESINLDPLTRSSYLNLAWLLATCADSSVRDGRRAMRLVEQAIPLSKTDDIRLLDVLAAAHAEAGRFEEAAQTASRALRSALAQSNQGLAEDIRSRMQLYQQRRAFRDAAAPGKAIKRPEYSRE